MLTDYEEKLIGKLREKIENFHQSIILLDSKNYQIQSLILFFSLIDQLSWLSTNNDFSTGSDFKNWINTYLNLSKINCSANDLWNTRCSLIHMDTSQHKNFNPKKDVQLAFYKNLDLAENLKTNDKNISTKFVDIGFLFEEYNISISNFIDDIFSNKELRKTVLNKVNLMTDHFY